MGEALLVPCTSVRYLGPGPALVLAPHGDDEVFGCGGAILRHVDAGDIVKVVVVTDGAGEAPDPDDPAPYVRTREAESRAAAQLLGYGVPEFWSLPDRGVVYGEGMVRRVMSTLRDAGARLLYAPSVMEMHPDHRALGMIAAEAVRRLGGDLSLVMYEVGIPLRPNRLLDISDLRERKRAAMRAFESQLAIRDYLSHVEALNRFRSYTLGPEVSAAEAYCVVSAQEARADPMELYVSEARRAVQLGIPLDEQDRPLISVIVRSHGDPTLQEALDSLALQTYSRIEVIVVGEFGQGHPSLKEWCGRFPLRVAGEQRPPLTAGGVANSGLDLANGEWISFLDDDALLDPDHYAGLAGLLEEHPSVGACFSGVRVVERGNADASGPARIVHEPFDARRLAWENTLPAHAVLFRRSLLDAGCRFDEQMDGCGDWDFWLQVAAHTQFLRLDRVSASYLSTTESGGGLRHERASRDRACRESIYRKWLPRWDAAKLDGILEECRRIRTESTALRRSLDDVRTQLNESETLAKQKEEVLLGALAAERRGREEFASRLEYIEVAHSRRWIVRLYHATRDWPVLASAWRLAATKRFRPDRGAGS